MKDDDLSLLPCIKVYRDNEYPALSSITKLYYQLTLSYAHLHRPVLHHHFLHRWLLLVLLESLLLAVVFTIVPAAVM